MTNAESGEDQAPRDASGEFAAPRQQSRGPQGRSGLGTGRSGGTANPGCLAPLLGVALVLVGAFVALLGPLLAVACTDCLDGVRGPLRFPVALLTLAHYVVPLVTVGGLVVMSRSRRRVRAGAVSLCAVLVLALAVMALGRITV